METKLSYLSLVPHLKSLRVCGYYQMDSKAPSVQKFIHTVYRRLVLGLMILYLTQQSMKVYQVRSDSVQVMETILLSLTFWNTMYKVCTIWLRAPLVEELLETMKGPVFNQGIPSHDVLLQATCRRAVILLRGFQCLSVTVAVSWSLYPMILHMKGYYAPFTIWFPFDETADPQFYYATLYTFLQLCWIAFGNSAMDSFISFIFVQSKTQIAILRLDTETLIERSKEVASVTGMEFTNAIDQQLKALMHHYAEIDMFNRKVQKIFGSVIILQFMLSGWILCATTYKMASLSPLSVDFIATGMYLMCMLWESFLLCYYGNDLRVESEYLLDSAYMMDWVQLPLSHRKTLILFMERIKRPMQLLGGGIIPLTNGTFIMILRSGYSFYAFLKNSS